MLRIMGLAAWMMVIYIAYIFVCYLQYKFIVFGGMLFHAAPWKRKQASAVERAFAGAE